MTDANAGAATPAHILRDRIMNPNHAKSEHEHWAARHIAELEERLTALSRPAPGRPTREEVADVVHDAAQQYASAMSGGILDASHHGYILADANDKLFALFSAPQDQPEDQGAFRANALHPTEREDGPVVGYIKLPEFTVPDTIVRKLASESRAWGEQCAGGAGGERGPGGVRYGEPYFQFADAIERLAQLTRDGADLAAALPAEQVGTKRSEVNQESQAASPELEEP